LKEKVDLEKQKKEMVDSAAEKERLLKKKVKTVGNIVYDNVPVSDNEVRMEEDFFFFFFILKKGIHLPYSRLVTFC
jgi:hypothetical protein